MNNIVLNKDIIPDYIKDKKIAIIGYGNQGRAQALNLKDSGLNVRIGLRKHSESKKQVEKDQCKWLEIKDAVKWADLISILVPDKIAPSVFKNDILNYLNPNDTLLFSHGYNIYYKLIIPPDNVNVIMVAPSGGGNIVRNEYKKGKGVPSLIAIHQNISGDALDIVKSYAQAIGSSRICIFMSTFKEETETDIFGEQAILTGGLPYLINSSYNALINNGYDSTVAWFVCYYEIKTIVDLFHDKGFEEFYDLVSDTARYGGLTRGKKLINENFENNIGFILNEIKSGKFNHELDSNENLNDLPNYFKDLNDKTKEMLDFIKNKLK
tara:strand:- start:119 stop:1090 length:972 start_codon:yes stop_codon:yes gene_type:complete